jgi:hypothetical protein
LSVAVRSGPVMTAMTGTLVARPARTTIVRTWQRLLSAGPEGEAGPR